MCMNEQAAGHSTHPLSLSREERKKHTCEELAPVPISLHCSPYLLCCSSLVAAAPALLQVEEEILLQHPRRKWPWSPTLVASMTMASTTWLIPDTRRPRPSMVSRRKSFKRNHRMTMSRILPRRRNRQTWSLL